MLDYYLWIPFLPTFCFGFTKFPRFLGRYFLENSLIKNILGGQNDPAIIGQNFLDSSIRHTEYHIYDGVSKLRYMLLLGLEGPHHCLHRPHQQPVPLGSQEPALSNL